MNLAQLLQRSAHAFPNQPAVVENTRVCVTFNELHQRSARIAGYLRTTLGLNAGDRVGLVMHNGPSYTELLFGCWHAGLTALPINAKLHSREFSYILEHSGCRACFVSKTLESAVATAAAACENMVEIITCPSQVYDRILKTSPDTLANTEPNSNAWLFYTSGTTGRPKGALLSHQNLMTMAFCYFADVDRIDPGDALVHAAPMSHGSGIYLIPHVMAGAMQVIPESHGFNADEALGLLARYPGSTMFAAPTMVRRLTDASAADELDTRCLKTIVYGGGPMYLADLDDAHQVLGYKLVQIYGQGESPMTITALSKWHHRNTDHPAYRQRLASVGIAQSAMTVRVATADGDDLPAGEVGEVLTCGDAVMQGYWCDPDTTQHTLAGGWLHTGDLGSLDNDGFLTLSDRAKDMIISGGSNIYPREVEEVLLNHPGIAEVSVVGAHDPEWGERVTAFVVGTDPPPSIEELDTLCLNHIARFKRPREYRFVDALPKNNYGKVLKTALREQLTQTTTTDV